MVKILLKLLQNNNKHSIILQRTYSITVNHIS